MLLAFLDKRLQARELFNPASYSDFSSIPLWISGLRLSRFTIAIYQGKKGIDVSILARTSRIEPLNGPVDSNLMDVSAAANLSESSME
jgi:hypothetical protein